MINQADMSKSDYKLGVFVYNLCCLHHGKHSKTASNAGRVAAWMATEIDEGLHTVTITTSRTNEGLYSVVRVHGLEYTRVRSAIVAKRFAEKLRERLLDQEATSQILLGIERIYGGKNATSTHNTKKQK